jgi:tetratricopeptide (TPR) repeat protein
LTQVYINTKYLYEVSSKIYETKQNKVPVHGLISMIKNKVQKLKLKKAIKEINQAYVKDNEIYLAKIKSDETVYIDMKSFEESLDFFKMFKEPMNKYVNNSIDEITKARKEAEEIPAEIQISKNVTVITRKEKIEELKKAKEELMQPEEIIIPTKTA